MGGPAGSGRRSEEPGRGGVFARARASPASARARRHGSRCLLGHAARQARALVPGTVLAQLARAAEARDSRLGPRQGGQGALPPRAFDAGRGVALWALALVFLAR